MRERPTATGDVVRRFAVLCLLTAVAGIAGALALRESGRASPSAAVRTPAATAARTPGPERATATPAPLPAPEPGAGTAPNPLAVALDVGSDPVRVSFKRRPRAGLLFDVDTGRVLWRHRPERGLPIASLTKIMTALVAVDRIPPTGKVRITKNALAYRGSGVGLLPDGRWIGISTMLHGLLLVSGNDAAIAIAQRAGDGRVAPFVARMNARARAMGLSCTHFVSPEGLGTGNRSCAADVAALARKLLRTPRLARVVRRRTVALRFPIKGGRLYLSNSNPLLRAGYRGVTGVKTGYTVAAGRCLVATVRRGRRHLGVVLLGSPDPGRQARQLLDRGFRVTATRWQGT
jgi:D-alanyl-D-alanine carboxypeptidase